MDWASLPKPVGSPTMSGGSSGTGGDTKQPPSLPPMPASRPSASEVGVLLLESPWLLVPALEGVELVLVLEFVGEKSTPASVNVARVPASGGGC